jgi:diguanylate cyclase (GGDEF)-like protein/PAS domain S-box-containing protein
MPDFAHIGFSPNIPGAHASLSEPPSRTTDTIALERHLPNSGNRKFTIRQPPRDIACRSRDLSLSKPQEHIRFADDISPVALPAAGDSRSFFNKLSSRISHQNVTAMPDSRTSEALLLLQNYEETRQGWFWSTNAAGQITYLTDSIAEIFGQQPAELIGTSFVDLFARTNGDDDHQRTLPFMLVKQSKFDYFAVCAARPGEERWWSISGQPQFDQNKNFTGYRGSGVDITAQRRSNDDTSRMATYDSLTGLLNRYQMSKKLETTLSAFKAQQRPCAVLLIDLDRFKQVNDTLGHPAGDALLKQVAERLLTVVGNKEKVCRLGGDEFQVMLPDTEDRGTLGDMAAEIIRSLSQPYSVEGSRCIIGASVGIAISPFDGFTSEELIRNADLALYAAKGNGRGRFRFYSSELHQAAEDRRILEDDLRDALQNGQMVLHYQPVVCTKTSVVTGAEALIRWTHPERGPISPSLFIPIAEEANMIAALGDWALKKACEDAATWPGNLRVAVNVSPVQFANDLLPKVVADALASSGLQPDRLELEITEGVFLRESAQTDNMFSALKNIGVRLALDDFGTGYSSLGYLQTAPFDKIKIDQSFVRGATEPGSRNGAIIAAIVALAEALGMETTAEGIETLDQLELIRALNVSHIQGFVYSQAVTDADLKACFDEGTWVITPSGPAKSRNDRLSMFRKVRVIHHDHCYSVVIRNLSMTGALIDGLLDVPVGTKFVVDFGEGQLAVATVRRSRGHQQGVEFEQRLVSDGNGGLCTSHRVSPYLMAAAGLSVGGVAGSLQPVVATPGQAISLPAFHTVDDWK